MSSSEFHKRKDFPDMRIPDMTIPESSARTPDVYRPVSSSPRSSWREGDRVLAPWEPQFLYAGKIVQIKDNEAMIEFDDGDAGWVFLDQIRTLAVERGQKVLSRRKMGPHFYPGEILEVHGESVRVGFADGHDDEWTSIAALRIPCQARGPAAAPTRVASHMAFFDNLQPGDRVWAPWKSNSLFAGTVDEIVGKEVHIHYDDGNRGWVQLDQLLPLEIPLGLRVMARWKMGAIRYPGTITRVDGERIFIEYDDGDREWTQPAALLVRCEPFGPDVRPTKRVLRLGTSWIWIVGVLIIAGLILLQYVVR